MIREYSCLDVTSLPRSDPITQTCSLLCELFKTDKTFVAEYENLQNRKIQCGSSPLDLSHELFCSAVHSFEGHGTDPVKTVTKPKEYHLTSSQSLENITCIDRDPLLKEALVILNEIIKIDTIEPLIKEALSSKQPLQTVGKLLWIVDRDPTQIQKRKNPEDFLQWIDQAFQSEITHLVNTLQKVVKTEKALGVQPAQVLEGTRIPIEISKFIITNTGAINTGLLKYMRHLFTGDEEVVFNHDISIKQTMEMLLSSPTLRECFSHIKAPTNPSSRVGTLIRVSLGYEREAYISDTDTKRVAMAALLSHLRQYANRSCFAAFIAINMKQGYLEDCLVDLISILDNGHLSREVEGTTQHFPFLMKMSNASLGRPFVIDKFGHVIRKGEIKGSIIQSSGLIAACQVMGIPEPEKALLQIAVLHHGEITPKFIIEQLARCFAHPSQSQKLAGKYYHEGCFAYGSKETNPLLKVWVNTIAGMAEGQANCYLGSCLMKSTLQVFHQFLVKKHPENYDNIEENILKELALSIRYMYDPSIGFVGSENDGGFVLYEVNRDSSRLKRIDNAKMFRDFLERIVDNARKRLKYRTSLEETFSTSTVVKQIIEAYKKQIRGSYLDLDEADIVKPWINLFGHNATTILQVYFENSESLNTYNIKPRNGYHLFKEILKMGKKLSQTEIDALLENAYTLKPVRIVNYHAFSLILGHTSLREIWTVDKSISSWLKKRLLIKGRKIASTAMSEGHRKRMERRIPDLKIPAGLSPREFRKWYLTGVENDRKQIALDLDKKLVETMDPEARAELNKTLVHFADTNLHSGVQDVHFCFLVNPGSGKVEVWQVNDDNNGLTPLDQRKICKKTHWEIYLDPESLQGES